MTIKLAKVESQIKETKVEKEKHIDAYFIPQVMVLGVGGAGGNAVQNMIKTNLSGVRFAVANTDWQSLNRVDGSAIKVQLGKNTTKGYGSGGNPILAKEAAKESIEEIKLLLKDVNMLFITAGMGGGTGTGASPIIAEVAKNMGILTIAIVTTPLPFETCHNIANEGIANLEQYIDTMVIISNKKLSDFANMNKISVVKAFEVADDVLYGGIRSITDLMLSPGLINLDFNDILTVMKDGGVSLIGTGEAEGEDRATIATNKAIDNKLLKDIDIKGAKKLLINITSSQSLTMEESARIMEIVRGEVEDDAFIKFGLVLDETMGDTIRISIIATSIDNKYKSTQPTQSTTSAIFGKQAPKPTLKTQPEEKVYEESSNYYNEENNEYEDEYDNETEDELINNKPEIQQEDEFYNEEPYAEIYNEPAKKTLPNKVAAPSYRQESPIKEQPSSNNRVSIFDMVTNKNSKVPKHDVELKQTLPDPVADQTNLLDMFNLKRPSTKR